METLKIFCLVLSLTGSRKWQSALLAALVWFFIAMSTAQADTVVVDTTNDVVDGNTTSIVALNGDKGPDGKISLREAIIAANNTSGLDKIHFNIPGPCPYTIKPLSALPTITGTVVIDGYAPPVPAMENTNPPDMGSNAMLCIELDGTDAGDVNGLMITADNCKVRGLAINRFSRSGIRLEGVGNFVEGNFLGTNVDGDAALGNGTGVWIHGSSTGNVVGGTTPAARNVISGNLIFGVRVEGSGAMNNRVQSNLIGTDKAGTTALGNIRHGVEIGGSSNNLIGGATPEAGNVISSNNVGVRVLGSGAMGNRVQGNLIGTNVTGSLIDPSLGNLQAGVLIDTHATDNTVGGPEAGNTIAFNGESGVTIDDFATANVIQGNTIESNDRDGIRLITSGNRAQGNIIRENKRSGVLIGEGPTDNNTIGPDNTIDSNVGDGVLVLSGTGHAILSNSIFSNGELGIDLLPPHEVTPNDAGDGDTGANNLQNFPVLTSATTSGGSITIEGTLNSTPSTTFRLEFFSNTAADPTDHGEGESFIGSAPPQMTDGGGNVSFTVTLSPVPPGQCITATATDLGNNTSEFSECIAIIGQPSETFEYAAKIVCGTQKESNNLRLARGIYATAINIHNPNDTSVEFLKKLALTYPPEEQEPGQVDTIGTDILGPDEALEVDCIDIRRKLFPNGFPTPFIKGFVVIKSPASLDVSAVYTSAKLGSFLSPQRVTSIDVEQIRERKTRGLPPPPTGELDHFKVYEVEKVPVGFPVQLTDQLDTAPKEANLDTLTHFANPTRKVHGGAQVGIKDSNRHLNWYAIRQQQEPRRTIRFRNQFGQHSVVIGNPRFLLVPAQKTSDPDSEFPNSLDHYKCYEVIEVNEKPDLPVVTLDDQFGSEQNVQVRNPRFFCMPVMKEREGEAPREIMNADDHLAIYDIPPEAHELQIKVEDQFGVRVLRVIRSVMLAVPTEKQVVVPHEN